MLYHVATSCSVHKNSEAMLKTALYTYDYSLITSHHTVNTHSVTLMSQDVGEVNFSQAKSRPLVYIGNICSA